VADSSIRHPVIPGKWTTGPRLPLRTEYRHALSTIDGGDCGLCPMAAYSPSTYIGCMTHSGKLAMAQIVPLYGEVQ
jgi:hypothetical protein